MVMTGVVAALGELPAALPAPREPGARNQGSGRGEATPLKEGRALGLLSLSLSVSLVIFNDATFPLGLSSPGLLSVSLLCGGREWEGGDSVRLRIWRLDPDLALSCPGEVIFLLRAPPFSPLDWRSVR